MKIRRKGSHSWDMHVHYHRCPECGAVFESRDDYEYRMGKYQKDLECTRCGATFSTTKHHKQKFGPIFN